jgi:hypothetical protein
VPGTAEGTIAAATAPEDVNGDAVICRRQSEEEGLVVVDDNDS